MKIENQKRAQFVLISLLMFFVTLVVVSILFEPMVEFINIGINATAGATHANLVATLMNYIPVFVVIVLLISLFAIISNRWDLENQCMANISKGIRKRLIWMSQKVFKWHHGNLSHWKDIIILRKRLIDFLLFN